MSEVVYCGQCGESNPEGNKFCGKCGKPLSITTSSSKMSLESDFPNYCPKCKKTDQIRKLSSISSAETRKTSGESYSSGRANIYDKDSNFIGDSHTSSSGYINVTEQSELAKKVSRPIMPPKPSEPKSDNPLAEKIMIGVVSILGLCAGPYAGSQLYENGASFIWQILGCLGGMLLAGLVGGIIIGLPLMLLAQPSQEQKLAYQEQLRIHEQHLAKWKRASERWEQMYYCYRDDVVFIPGESETIHPSNTVQFCYQNIKE
jgi:hypothetical protein